MSPDWQGIQTEPVRLADGPNRAQRRAADKKARNPNDGREQAIHEGRKALRAKRAGDDFKRETRNRRK